MKKIILAAAVGLAVISCKNENETTTTVTSDGTGEKVALDQSEIDASYAYGISLGQNAERYSMGMEDSLDYDELQKGINDFMKNPEDMDSYAFGLNTGKQIQGALDNKVIGGRLDKEEIIKGMMDYLNKKETRVKVDSVAVLMDNFFQNQMRKSAENNTKRGLAFMNDIKQEAGVQTTPSGLAYKVIQEGTGEKASTGDIVTVKYTGTTIDGEVFDGTDKNNKGEPVEFPLNPGGLIQGWIEGMQLMNKGAKYKFFIPSELAYGEQGSGAIGPGETLIFDIELVDFVEGNIPQMNPGMPGVNIVPNQPTE